MHLSGATKETPGLYHGSGSQWPLTMEAQVSPCGICDIVALGKVFLLVLQFSPVYHFRRAPYSCIIWGMNNRSTGACSSET
jgi:hypothetical protein